MVREVCVSIFITYLNFEKKKVLIKEPVCVKTVVLEIALQHVYHLFDLHLFPS